MESKCENEDDLNLFLNKPNFIQNGTIIPMLLIMTTFLNKILTRTCIFQFTKYEQTGVSESIDSYNRNFTCVKPEQIF